MKNFDDAILLRYLAKNLARHEQAELEHSLREDSQLAQRLAYLRNGELPYRAAFDHAPLPPLPASLVSQVALWSRLSQHENKPVKKIHRWPHWQSVSGLLTSATNGGIAVFGLQIVLAFSLGLGAAAWWFTAQSSEHSWVHAVAMYQRLYQRETISNLSFDPLQTKKTLSYVQMHYGMQLNAPQLPPDAMTLKRVQILALGERPIVQMVYLPPDGTPIALCATLAANTNKEGLRYQKEGGQNILSWQQQGVKYLLMGTQPEAELRRLQTQLQPLLIS